MDINTNIFRAYDIRGVAYEDLTEEIVSKLGKSLGTSSLNRGETLLVVARDGRNSSPDMYEWLSRGIRSTGCNVLNIGIVPTPLLYFSTFKLSSSSGVMITGSHNPSEYNGFKIVRDNKTISGKTIQEVKLSILENKFLTGKGSVSEQEIVEMYSSELRNNIDINYLLYETIEIQTITLNVKNDIRISIYDKDGELLEPSLPEYCYPRRPRKEIQTIINLQVYN